MRIKMLASFVLAGALVANRTNAQQDSMKPKVTQTAAGDVSLPLGRLTMRVLGVYFDTDNKRDSVEVFDLLAEKSYILYKDRVFPLNALASQNDSVAFAVRKIGFVEQQMIATIAPADTTPITIVLEKLTSSIQLPAMITIARASISNLEAHGKAGAKVIPSSVLRSKEYENYDLAKALEKNDIHIFDLKAQLDPTGRVRPGRQSSVACPVRVLLEGSPIGSDLVRYDDQAGRYGGVEYYKPHTTVPEEFNQGSNPCGLLVLWSRER